MQALYTHPLECTNAQSHTDTHTYSIWPRCMGPRDYTWNYFLFGSREKGEVVRMKSDVTTAVVFLCAPLRPGCYPEFTFPWSLIESAQMPGAQWTTARHVPQNAVQCKMIPWLIITKIFSVIPSCVVKTVFYARNKYIKMPFQTGRTQIFNTSFWQLTQKMSNHV